MGWWPLGRLEVRGDEEHDRSGNRLNAESVDS
jgi:hypothetical protein